MSFISKQSFSAKNYNLFEFINSRAPSKFLIPDFQRRFVWETKQLTDFIDSLYTNESGYYIGTIVDVRPNLRSYDFEIIDGQQRITSLTFCIKVLLDLLNTRSENGDSLIPKELENFSELFLLHETQPRLVFNDKYFYNHFKLLLNEANPLEAPEVQDWLRGIQKKVDEEPKSIGLAYDMKRSEIANLKSVTRLFNTYKDIQNYFNDFTTKELIDVFYKIAHLQLVEITCEERKTVNTLFEGMNSKGVLLSNADLIKNKLFARIDLLSKDLDAGAGHKDSWDDVDLLFFVEVDKRLFDKFLRHFWISKNGYISGSKVYDAYVKEIDGLKSTDEISRFIKEIYEYANYYISIRHMIFNYETHGIKIDPRVYQAFNDFGKINNEQIYEVLLAIIRFVKTDQYKQIISTKDLLNILSKLWAFCFRLQFTPVSPSKYENRFADICGNFSSWVEGESSLALELNNYISLHLRPLVSDSEQFINNLSSEFGYKESLQNHRLLEKIFYDLFRAYDKNQNFDKSYQYIKPTIEHILPRKPDRWNYRKVEIKDFVNNLGNLTLLDEYENNIADNNVFETKLKKVYLQNKYQFNKDLTNYKEGFASGNLSKIATNIQKRSITLAKSLFDIYSI